MRHRFLTPAPSAARLHRAPRFFMFTLLSARYTRLMNPDATSGPLVEASVASTISQIKRLFTQYPWRSMESAPEWTLLARARLRPVFLHYPKRVERRLCVASLPSCCILAHAIELLVVDPVVDLHSSSLARIGPSIWR
jgi:hypothetical protein